MKLSIIIPLYNEEKRISKTISFLENYLKNQKFEIQVIFVDDGSTDKTITKLKSLESTFKYELVSYQPNRGKGAALRRGAQEAAGDYVLFLDADMSTPISEFDKFKEFLDPKTVLIGTRKGKGAKVLRHQPFIREKMGEFYTLLARLLFVRELTDFTCGFKCFPKEVSNKVFGRSLLNRWSFDSEILFLTKKFGYRIKEIPVSWTDDPGTKVKLGRDAISSFLELLAINLYNIMGRYN